MPRKTARKTKPKSARKELAPMDDVASTLIPTKRRESLIAWFEVYLAVNGGPSTSNTFKAKKSDLQKFIDYILGSAGTDHPDQWTRSITMGFIDDLSREQGLAPTSINRALATLKHAAKWLESQRPFLAGNPCENVSELVTDDPEWNGLEDRNVVRLRSAAEQRVKIKTKPGQQPLRDQAMLLLLLHSALRVSEMLRLDLTNYDGKHLRNIRRKGKRVTRELLLAKPAREALEDYMTKIRGREAGPLFQSKSGKRLAPQNVDEALKAIADQANASLPEEERIHLSAHMLRHTALRKAAEKHDIRYARKLSGHTSDRYIWRYTQPSKEEEEKAIEELF